jgi:hypothetical protein
MKTNKIPFDHDLDEALSRDRRQAAREFRPPKPEKDISRKPPKP